MKEQIYNQALCERDHTDELPQSLLDSLPESQKQPIRHRCAGCAYEAGMNEAAKDFGELAAKVKALTEENERLRSLVGR